MSRQLFNSATFILLSLLSIALLSRTYATEITPPNHIEYMGKKLYLNGYNLAWIDFAKDFGTGINEPALRETLSALKKAGGNSLRWWVHTDGSQSPAWEKVSGEMLVAGPGGSFIADMKHALDIAAEYDVYIIPSLWSFDMLKCNDYRSPPNADNARLLRNDKVLQSYIDKVLTPLVKELNAHPQLIAWELFNEPENMTEHWLPEQAKGFWHWDDSKKESTYIECETPFAGPFPTLKQLQRTQALMSAAIHRTAASQNQTALVTTGTKSMGKYSSDVAGGYNWYSDERMIKAADGDTLATLDFYEPHYYNNEGKDGAWSPFHHRASYWEVDKPIVIGEFHPHALDVLGDKVEADQLCKRLRELGYAGGWSWQWADGEKAQHEVLACMKNMK